ncbi:MAG: hypothetical protein HWE20_14140 [Gammaproteobacteria bacterium]|nr:hypothetical protein [Gammaproteobacteria bacterium]
MSVMLVQDIKLNDLVALYTPYGLKIELLSADAEIPGTFWGAPEAGLVGSTLYIRPDTPVHSALHEGCHYVCMDQRRKLELHTNAGGTVLEECAVCYLQLKLSDSIVGFGFERALQDMDQWGYSFRLGSAKSWFYEDAEDAMAWLISRGLLTHDGDVESNLTHYFSNWG